MAAAESIPILQRQPSRFFEIYDFPGGCIEGATPVPIPNTVVKPFGADGTAWVTVWESRTLPGLIPKARRNHNDCRGLSVLAFDLKHSLTFPLPGTFATRPSPPFRSD